ncbi:MAG: hypothetical protein DSM107014_15310 [Gomphosphaeria aponina SAG 52.96 = DSM 107014]|uniref:Uncharacterized protein n=1 Tax=Gomphosphaeria aponina SAG 52.96 = DSM 107014 TaxID=1521640 RepID=A0A941JSZ1_9CHRO|nr:hypothetical protein [Gomphosphaeria aponina SAG 52.96 = DSM 107014]
MGKYIIFKTESASAEGWETRKLNHTGALTNILAEHYDASDAPLPEVGYRIREYHQIEPFTDSKFPGASTHSRTGDWKVTKVEEYLPNLPNSELESIVICYCKYAPVMTPLDPLPKIQVSGELIEVET